MVGYGTHGLADPLPHGQASEPAYHNRPLEAVLVRLVVAVGRF
jgi:hypothetical protein